MAPPREGSVKRGLPEHFDHENRTDALLSTPNDGRLNITNMLRKQFRSPTEPELSHQQSPLVNNPWSIRPPSAMSTAFSDTFSTQMLCPMCLERNDEPKMLPCFHTFCRRCVDKLASPPTSAAIATQVTCPTCNEDVAICDEPRMDNIPPSYLNFLMELPIRDTDYENGMDAMQVCTSCDERNRGVARCRDCNEVLCNNCVSAHHRVRLTKDHIIVKFSDSVSPFGTTFQSIATSLGLGAQAFATATNVSEGFCNVHKNEELGFYCEFCRQSLCAKCRFQDHTSHNVTFFKEAIAKYQNQSRRLLAEAQSDLKDIEESIVKIERMGEKVDNRVKTIAAEVRGVALRFKTLVDERERELLRNLDKIRQLKVKSLHMQLDELRGTLLTYKKTHEYLKCSLENGNDLDVLAINHKAGLLVQEIRQMRNHHKPYEDDCILYSPPNGSLPMAIQNIGHLTSGAFGPHCTAEGDGLKRAVTNKVASFVIICYDHLGKLREIGGEAPVVIVKSPQRTILPVEMSDRKNGTYTLNYQPITQGEHIISIMVNGLHVKRSPFTVNVRVPRELITLGEPVLTFGTKGEADGQLRRPWGVCCDKDGHIIVADRSNNRIQIFTMKGIFLHKFGTAGAAQGEFNLPAGVAVDGENNIIVADKDNHRIQVFTFTGKFMRTFGEKGSEDGQFKYPWDVAVNSQRQILVSDSRNHRIQLFTPDGQFLRKYGFEGHLWKNFDSPRGVCFTQNDKILVTDFNNHRILVIMSDFQTAQFLGNEGTNDGEFRRPQGIAVDAEGHLIVADSRNNRIQIFLPHGPFLHAFGTMGSGPGQLNCPSGICVSPDGHIIVVDFENTRIQVF